MISLKDLKPENKLFGNISEEDGVMTVRFHKGSYRDFMPDSGISLYSNPLNLFPARHVKIEYLIKFSNGFNFNKGLKLPFGFCIGERGSNGGKKQEMKNKGASVRIMARKNGQAELYLYLAKPAKSYKNYWSKKDKNFGDRVAIVGNNFVVDEWNKVILEVKINDIDKVNGMIRFNMNGKQIMLDDCIFFEKNELPINQLWLCNFYGGQDKSWACKNDCYIQLKEISLVNVF